MLQLHHEPAVLVLSRQAVPTIDRKKYAAASGLAQGAYVLADAPCLIKNHSNPLDSDLPSRGRRLH
jgi:transketolase